MKRSWFGFLLLIALLAAALTVTWVMSEIHRPVAWELQQAAEYALSENWTEADAAAQRAEAQWQTWVHVRLCFADHTPVEDIDSTFAELRAYGAQKEAADFAAACLSLGERVEAIGKAHGLSLESLF